MTKTSQVFAMALLAGTLVSGSAFAQASSTGAMTSSDHMSSGAMTTKKDDHMSSGAMTTKKADHMSSGAMTSGDHMKAGKKKDAMTSGAMTSGAMTSGAAPAK